MADSMKVVPIRSGRSMKALQQEIVELAFQNWLARLGVLEGSPEDDLYQAQREVMARSAWALTLHKGVRRTIPIQDSNGR